MSFSVFLLIVAGFLALLGLVFGHENPPSRRFPSFWILPVAVILIVIALLLGTEPLIST